MGGKWFNIKGKKISEETIVTMDLKTFIAVLTVVSGIIIWAYNKIQGDVDKLKTTIEKISSEQGEVKGDIKVILDRTSGIRGANNDKVTDKPFKDEIPK